MSLLPVVDPLILDRCLREAYARARVDIPIVTGNLRDVSKRIVRVGPVNFKTYFDVAIAPYAERVNLYSPKSAGWFLRFQETYKKEIEIELRKVGYIV